MRALLDGTASTVTTRLLLIIIHEWIIQDTMWDGKPQKMDIKWFTKSLKTALALKEVVLLLQK